MMTGSLQNRNKTAVTSAIYWITCAVNKGAECYAKEPEENRRGTGLTNKRFLVSSVAESKAGRQEKRADRANYGELLKDFASVST